MSKELHGLTAIVAKVERMGSSGLEATTFHLTTNFEKIIEIKY